MLHDALQGFLMSIADSIPGISGSTIAFILGFYERLIKAFHDVIQERGNKRKESLCYLAKFSIGWIIGISACVLMLTNLFQTHVYFMCSLFLGLMLIALPVIGLTEEKNLKVTAKHLALMLLGVIIVVVLVKLRTLDILADTIDFSQSSLWLYPYLFIGGILAVISMILPGISGSTLLLITGIYLPLMTAFKALFQFQFVVLPAFIFFGFGVLIGGISSIFILHKAISTYRSEILHFIIGLMIGSIYAIVMAPTSLSAYNAALSIHNFSLIGFMLGLVLLITLERIKNTHKHTKRTLQKNISRPIRRIRSVNGGIIERRKIYES